MAPSASRRVFVWSLSTIFLLGFLWYKRKKSSLRSDPGGTDSKTQGEILKDCDSSVKKSPSAAAVQEDIVRNGKSVVDLEVGNIQTTCVAGIFKDSCVVEKSLINASSNFGEGVKHLSRKGCETEVIQERLQDSNCSLDRESCDSYTLEKDNNTTVETCDKGSCPGDENNFKRSSTTLKAFPEVIAAIGSVGSQVSEEICKQRIASNTDAALEVECKEKFVKVVETVPIVQKSVLNPDAADFILSTIQDSVSEQNYQNKKLAVVELEDITQCCDFERDKISQVKLITGEVSDSQSNAVSTSRTIVDQLKSQVVACKEERGDPSVIQVHALQDEQLLEINSDQTVLVQDTSLSPKQSWATEVELELDEENVTDSTPVVVVSLSKSAEMARESSGDIACESPAIEDNTVERTSSSLETKLSALQLEESAGKNTAEGVKERHGIERDSANHSPAEVMLESPSISNYSDAQSEGSSDSGKGGSDVATPPSRTPASGSSVAGDLPLPSVFEFVLPQFLVGRLIGRHGLFVHQIKAKTNANIFIKRHPETAKMKICAIEGTQMDIESALDMIRQKFPLKRYPNVTLEQVSFLPPVAAFPLGTDSFMVQLIEGVNNDVIVSSLVTPAHFFLQQPTHPTYPALNRLNVCMSICYNEPTAPVLPAPVAADVVCVAPTMGGWFRAQVVSTDPENGTCDVRFMDYGGYLTVEYSALRQIRQDFLTLPFQAAECYLANVKPTNGVWTQEAIAYVEELTHGQVIQAQIYGYAENGVPAIYLFSIQGSEVVVVNQELVSRGYAEFEEPTGETVSVPFEGQALTPV